MVMLMEARQYDRMDRPGLLSSFAAAAATVAALCDGSRTLWRSSNVFLVVAIMRTDRGMRTHEIAAVLARHCVLPKQLDEENRTKMDASYHVRSLSTRFGMKWEGN